jgi:hypothetical protein
MSQQPIRNTVGRMTAHPFVPDETAKEARP